MNSSKFTDGRERRCKDCREPQSQQSFQFELRAPCGRRPRHRGARNVGASPEMVVHVDQTGYRELPGQLEHLRVTRDASSIGAIDCHNAPTANHDRHVRSNDRLSDIDDRDVVEYDRRLTARILGMKQDRQSDAQQ